jgi:L-fuculose-phosphate aldolase
MVRTGVKPARFDALCEEVAAGCRSVAEQGLALGGAGNVSVRTDDAVLITRAGLRLEQAQPDDISVVSLEGETLHGSRPSSETGLHLNIYQRSRARAVVHTHGQASVAVGLVCDELPLVHYNLTRAGGQVPTIPYYTFGSEELAQAVGVAIEGGTSAVLMRNHGMVTCASSLSNAIEKASLCEWMCGVYLDAKSIGDPHLLTEGDLAEVQRQARRFAYGDSKEDCAGSHLQ